MNAGAATTGDFRKGLQRGRIEVCTLGSLTCQLAKTSHNAPGTVRRKDEATLTKPKAS